MAAVETKFSVSSCSPPGAHCARETFLDGFDAERVYVTAGSIEEPAISCFLDSFAFLVVTSRFPQACSLRSLVRSVNL